MRSIRSAILVVGVAGVLAALFNGDIALATDGVAQAETALKNYIKIAIGFAGLVGVGFVVVGAIKYSTASGHPDKMEKAKDTIKHALIGVVIALGAFVLVDIVSDVAKKAFGS